MSLIASTISTKVYTSDYEKFRIFLINEGFQNTKVINSPKSSFLKLQFLSAHELASYQSYDIEARFLKYNSNYYYHDLDY